MDKRDIARNFLTTFSILIAAITIISYSHNCDATNLNQIDSLKARFLPPEYRHTNFTVDDLKRIYREKCKKASGIDNSTLYVEIEKAATNLMTCITNIANITAIQEEIAAARPMGELDTVFHKYCLKAPQIETCLRNFSVKVQPCLTPEEKNQNAVLLRVISGLIGFMCTKGGDQIALFVAEEGPECLEANKEAIGNCLNQSFSEYIPKDGSMPDLFNLPEFILQPKHCIDMERFEKCTIHHLEQCEEITPANVAESIFKFVKNETSCKQVIQNKDKERSVLKQTRNSAVQNRIAYILVGLTSLYLLLLK